MGPTEAQAPSAAPATPPGSTTTPNSTATPTPRRRYHELDLLRLVAALAVVGFHYLFRGDPTFARTDFSDPGGIFRYGYLGVDLFFVISGFVILNSAWNKSASAFAAGRIGRLYPAFWVACTLTALVVTLDPNDRFQVTPAQWLVNLTMVPTLFDVSNIDGVYWTLLVELKFYLLIMGLCALGLTLQRVLIFAVGWLAMSVLHAMDPMPNLLAELLVPDWAAYFVSGILFALVAREGWRVRYTLPLLAAYGWSLYLAVEFAARQSDRYGAVVSPVVVIALLTAVFGIFALIASHRLQARWTAKVAGLGALTYPLYLLHENIGFVLFTLLHGTMSRWVVLATVLAIAIAAAWTLHVAVEKRCAAPLARWITARWRAISARSAGIHPIQDAHNRHWPTAVTPALATGRIR